MRDSLTQGHPLTERLSVTGRGAGNARTGRRSLRCEDTVTLSGWRVVFGACSACSRTSTGPTLHRACPTRGLPAVARPLREARHSRACCFEVGRPPPSRCVPQNRHAAWRMFPLGRDLAELLCLRRTRSSSGSSAVLVDLVSPGGPSPRLLRQGLYRAVRRTAIPVFHSLARDVVAPMPVPPIGRGGSLPSALALVKASLNRVW